MCAIALFLNIIGLIFLIKITPPKQAVIRNYLILIQVLLENIRIIEWRIQANLILIDIMFDVGFCPIFLFPAPAGYVLGLLMHVGLSAHAGFVC